ncbi:streptogrisin C [Halopolyspora algeriensis]|uniref:Streptogrisin C n=1 Tax=Halopolyspora algeriensis TaxID=1500506 RepID=A0A368VPT1_9ACTN|nr:S1 family peptidase [Halopolyspora algeriensis]RCW43550.1 streptogrisin C [Halopolyspora algeriensis]TQM46419.1 streptogrisin C [Halopolyspora algeriensis]TQM47665.1 streptogrisin C [Halopolyspora algeriensis]
MKRGLAARMAGTVTLVVGTVAAWAMPATAAPEPTSPSPDTVAETPLEAMRRDLGLTLQQVEQRLHRETRADRIDERLRAALGTAFGGSHFDADLGTLVVGVTDRAKLEQVRAAGAKAELVDDSASVLHTVADTLDKAEQRAPSSISGWYVDPADNSVVVTTASGSAQQATEFIRSTGVDTGAVRVVESRESPRLFADIIGGNAFYNTSSSRCSIGFAVQGGFITAGHCGNQGDSTTQPSGTFAGSSFPSNDYAYVKSSATPKPQVNNYRGGTVTVAGAQEAPVGASVCRSGSTSGWHCGTIAAKNQTVRYQQGTVSGLTRTDVCAEPGDSGGPFLSGDQAQGVASGGSGDCNRGGVTYFQPINEALQAYGVDLITGG